MTNDQRTPVRSPGWRRFFQYRLRTLMLFTAAVAVGMFFYTRLEVLEEQPLPGHSARWQAYRTSAGTPVRHGWWELRDADRRLVCQGGYRNDQPHGAWSWRHPSGRVRQQGDYQRGKRHGVWKTFYEEGQSRDEFNYADGEVHGPARSWRPGGELASEGEYVAGRQCGTWTVIDEQGQTAIGEMAADLRVGRWQVWNAAGEELPPLEYVAGAITPSEPALAEAWHQRLRAPGHAKKVEAAWALSRLGEPGLAMLDEATRANDAEVRGVAFVELARQNAWCDAHIDRLIAALDEPSQRVRLAVMRPLAQLGEKAQDAVPKLLRLVSDSVGDATTDEEDAIYQACVLATIVSIDPQRADVAEKLLARWPWIVANVSPRRSGLHEEPVPEIAAMPYSYLFSRAQPAIRAVAKSKDPAVRNMMLRVLDEMPVQSGSQSVDNLGLFITLLEDSDAAVRAQACENLYHIGLAAIAAESRLEQLTHDPDSRVSNAALRAIGAARGQSRGGGFF